MGVGAEKRQCLSPAFFFVLEKAVKSAGNAVIPTFPMHRSHGLQHLRHKRPTFAFTHESGYTLGFRRKIAHSGLHGETRGVSALCEVDRGMIQQAGGNGCARLQRVSASSGVATPLGCGNLFFCYSVVIFAPLPVWSTTGIINQDY